RSERYISDWVPVAYRTRIRRRGSCYFSSETTIYCYKRVRGRMTDAISRIASFKNVDAFQNYLRVNRIAIPCDSELHVGHASPLAQPLKMDGLHISNRFAIQPMEGWDGTTDGRPTELTARRWRRFGASGAKLIWGGEAVAVCREGRANPNQLIISEQSL